ncbi:hypothetical protein CEE37_03695 [candidate division LCP-89 bacterium B3_LCP]|uniref:NAD-dependent epimerase/dehydratase domain-containing protein n=1 Tax=candidate division LCP-89 bacterium B3_LCP TaxID=2012998 RepID=A0A532V392_UNCL8|nr:MAG: hypothetical protein CEE37_03695 [candidate division LCP-89 bacterium B3_LCP]
MNRPVLVTGGNGFVGSHVVEELLQEGYSVRCLLRPHSRPDWIETLPVDIVRTDYSDLNSLREAISGCEAILHFGGATKAKNKESYFDANARTTGNLLEAATDVCPDLSLFLFCSSQAAVGPSPSLDPLDENAPPHPISAYGWSKMTAEKICLESQAKFPLCIVRPSAVYGPRDKDILIFFKAMRWGIAPAIGRGERYLSMVYVKDIARLCGLILKKKPQGTQIFHVTDGDMHRWSTISDTIAEAMDKRPLRVNVPVGLTVLIGKILSGYANFAGRIATLNREKIDDILQNYWLISSDKAQKELGFKPKYKLSDGVEETVRWYREHGWL